MFEIKVNTSPLKGTVLAQRDSMSLLYNGEELSNFTIADTSKQASQLIREKIEQLYPFIKVSIWREVFGFSGVTLTTSDKVTPKHSIDITMKKMDLCISDYDFDESFEKIQDFLGRLNQGVTAFVYTLTHTPEDIAKEIQETESKLAFLKSL